MPKAVIVIGSSYGDEGKGLTAMSAARHSAAPCLGILINGGPQRGHTVELRDGCRHVFHHFSAASACGAASYLDEDFMVNPMLFEEERERLASALPDAELRCLISKDCRVTLPYDMMLNQILEDARGEKRHGSCGMGVFETRRRYEQTGWALRWGELSALDEAAFVEYCRRIVLEYLPARCADDQLRIPDEWKELLSSEAMMLHTYDDVQAMCCHTELCESWEGAAKGFETLVFEAAQGLALDEDNMTDYPHLTPSHTTSLISAKRVAALGVPCDTSICYVTRTYLTRHGAGPLPNECKADDIAPGLVDLTNRPNPFQQTLRYGHFDGEAVRARILTDLNASRRVLPDAKAVLIVTHLNETAHRLDDDISLSELAEGFDHVGLADQPYDVKLH